jgi:hypothetical protein
MPGASGTTDAGPDTCNRNGSVGRELYVPTNLNARKIDAKFPHQRDDFACCRFCSKHKFSLIDKIIKQLRSALI